MTEVPWRGVLPSLPTLFADDGEVDVEAFCRVARFAIDSRAHGLVCFGLAGEVSRLTVAERERLLEAIAEEVSGRLPILAGVTAENLATSQRLARHAEKAGAAGIVLPPPTTLGLSDEDLVDFIVEVAGVTALPAIVQHAPEYLGSGVRPDLVRAAASRAPNVIGVKLEDGPEGIEAWRAALGPNFAIYGGNGGMYLLDCLRSGADGVMPGVDTVDLQVKIAELELEGLHSDADHLFSELLPLLVFEMQGIDHYNACAKHVLRRRSVDVPLELRAPGPRKLASTSAERLDGYLERLGIALGEPAPSATS